MGTGGAGAAFVQWSGVVGMPGVSQVERTHPGEGLAVTAGARRQHAVEHVHAALDRPDEIVGLADSHQVARRILGQLSGSEIERGEHGLLPFPYRQTADRVTIEPDLLQRLRAIEPKLFVESTLLDAE